MVAVISRAGLCVCRAGGSTKKTDFKYLLTSVIVAVKIKQYYKEAENIPFFSKQSTLPEKYHGRKKHDYRDAPTTEYPGSKEVKGQLAAY